MRSSLCWIYVSLSCLLLVQQMAIDANAALISASPSPMNDPAVGIMNAFAIPGPDVVIVDKTYTALGQLGLEILVVGPTPFIDITETITNNTGVDWTDFHWELTADNAFFVGAPPLFFPNKIVNPTTVWGDGAVLSAGNQFAAQLFVDASNVPLGSAETIRITQHPTTNVQNVIPEPSSLAIWFGAGVIGCGLAQRRRKRSA